jgi:hypothetical protein
MIQANVITIVNYDRHLFIVQATGVISKMNQFFFSFAEEKSSQDK